MKKIVKLAVTIALCSAYAMPAAGGEVENRIELSQTGESARVNSPECKSGNLPTAADIVLKVGSSLIDRYIGYPIAGTFLDNTSPGNRDWLKGRLGIHAGKSSCSTLCVIHPRGVNARYSTCLSETGGEGYGCRYGDNGDIDPPAYAGVDGVSVQSTPNGMVFCATGKNWSHNRNRWFIVKATW